VLEATVDRRPLMRVWRALDALGLPAALGGDAAEWSPARFGTAFAEPERITHRVDVRAQWQAKRAAMAAHASQAGGGEGTRTLSLFLRLPPRMFRRVFGHEWFVERGRPAPGRPLDDIFASFGSTWAGDPSPPVPGA
jgi:LmbE family N-acetylglucosaminyl deacetylase